MPYQIFGQSERLDKHLTNNSYYLQKHGIYYVPSPKVATTNIKRWILGMHLGPAFTGVDCTAIVSREPTEELVIHDAIRTLGEDLLVREPAEIEQLIASPEVFKFTIVRHPYSRLFSAWWSKIVCREGLHFAPFENNPRINTTIDRPEDIGPYFEQFLAVLAEDEELRHSNNHWAPQSHFLRPDLFSYDRVFHIERPQEIVEQFTRLLGERYAATLFGRSANESLLKYDPSFLTANAKSSIDRVWAADFTEFGYRMEPDADLNRRPRDGQQLLPKAVAAIQQRNRRVTQIAEQRDHAQTRGDRAWARITQQQEALRTGERAVRQHMKEEEALSQSLQEKQAALTDALSANEALRSTMHASQTALQSSCLTLKETQSREREQSGRLGNLLAEKEIALNQLRDLQSAFRSTCTSLENSQLQERKLATLLAQTQAELDSSATGQDELVRALDESRAACRLTTNALEQSRALERDASERLRETRSHVDGALAECRELATQLQRVTTELQRSSSMSQSLSGQLEDAVAELNAHRSSWWWRVTRPLRTLGVRQQNEGNQTNKVAD